MIWPTLRDWIFSAKAFSAAMLALFLALALDLTNPYWAMTTVYVVMNPLTGATTSKAVFRMGGTLIGAAGAVLLVPVLVNAPELLVAAISIWVGALLYLALLDRTPRSYLFMLAGYTLPLIALPAIGAPGTIFDVAIARSQEIIIGIICASVVGAVVFPVSIGPVVAARAGALLRDAGDWAREILRGDGASPTTPLARQRMAADIAALDALIVQLSFDAEAHGMAVHARELRARLLYLLPIISTIADRMHALRLEDGTLPPQVTGLTERIADWMTAAAPGGADTLLAEIAALEGAPALPWHGLVRRGLTRRLALLVETWDDAVAQRHAIAGGPQPAGYRRPALLSRERHHDHAMIFFACASAAAATFLSGLVWIWSGWAGGASLMAITAVACCFFGAMDQPMPPLKAMFQWTAISLVGAGIYLFGILPGIREFELLALVLAPPMLLIGLLSSRPQFMLATMLLAANGTGSLALQNRYSADLAAYVNGGIGVLAGIAFAMVWTSVVRPFGAGLAARRLARAGWEELSALAAGQRDATDQTHLSRALDRLAQLAPRLAANDNLRIDSLAEMRVGYALLCLRRERLALPEAARGRIERVLNGVTAHFRRRAEGGSLPARPGLRASIDLALAALGAQPATPAAIAAAEALTGLRRGLYPETAGPAAMPLAPQPRLEAV
ncbi:FUSC family protein [Roseococcus sp. YIM B11640]|uniref:FUSC family protein n=1 Tax=Roseococcus sp. YIM B11640 TaxID=3133973 RepID=UPI003C79C42D